MSEPDYTGPDSLTDWETAIFVLAWVLAIQAGRWAWARYQARRGRGASDE